MTATAQATTDPDDDHIRYVLIADRGVDPLMDSLRPYASTHTIVIVGSRELARRLNDAEAAGKRSTLSFRRES